MAEHIAGSIDDFPPGTHRVVRLGRIEVGVFNVAGRFYALPNICPHQFGPLCTGTVNGTTACSAEIGSPSSIISLPFLRGTLRLMIDMIM